MKIVAIGDIHGCSNLLRNLLAKVEEEWEWEQVVFLGDYIDGGPDSKGVIEEILQLQQRFPRQVICLKGNHELEMLECLRDPDCYAWPVHLHGLTTIRSYSEDLAQAFQKEIRSSKLIPELAPLYHQLFYNVMPAAHLQFFQNLAKFYRNAGAIFVHAGIDPQVPLEDQQEEHLCYKTLHDFEASYQYREHLIFGHTFAGKLRGDNVALPYISGKLIGLDTWTCVTGVLTAYRWPDGAVLRVGNSSKWLP